MPQDITKGEVNIGNIIYHWTMEEYEQHDRGKGWYLAAALVGGLMLVWAVFTSNYLFALVVVLFGIVLYLHEVQQPMPVDFALTDTGIVIGRKYYRYSEFSNFWLIYNPPHVKNLYFTVNKSLRHRLQVPLLDYDPRPVREHLIQFLDEDLDQEEEPLSERLGRLMKIH